MLPEHYKVNGWTDRVVLFVIIYFTRTKLTITRKKQSNKGRGSFTESGYKTSDNWEAVSSVRVWLGVKVSILNTKGNTKGDGVGSIEQPLWLTINTSSGFLLLTGHAENKTSIV